MVEMWRDFSDVSSKNAINWVALAASPSAFEQPRPPSLLPLHLSRPDSCRHVAIGISRFASNMGLGHSW